MEANAALTLDAEARRRLYRVYQYLLSLHKRRESEAADRGEAGDHSWPAAGGTLAEKGKGREVFQHDSGENA